MAKRVLAFYRSPTYSPAQHASNDTAILDATLDHFALAGWQVLRAGEDRVMAGGYAAADLYLNMCQGIRGSEALLALERGGAPIFNRPSSVLGCHRHRLVGTMEAAGLPHPVTVLTSTAGPLLPEVSRRLDVLHGETVWIKRGDVHAERADDVVQAPRRELAGVLAAFARRGIRTVAVQEHIPGPVVKFYGVASGGFFHAFHSETKAPITPDIAHLAQLRELAFAAAARVGLDVFGGDVAMHHPDHPVLIDLNDWPSFAPVRQAAAEAIATHIRSRLERGLAA